MGTTQMGPPRDLILQLKQAYKVQHFIETGTYLGQTASWAASQFADVHTIEAQSSLHEAAKQRFPDQGISWHLGDTRTCLPRVLKELKGPGIFWLDAHWSGGITFGEAAEDECPLLEELAILRSDLRDHFILIDDARLFLSPPQQPHRIESWPSIDRVIDALRTAADPYIVIHEDVIISVPRRAQSLVARYCQEASTHAWQAQQSKAQAARSSSLPKRLMGMFRSRRSERAAA
ncbi:hypothetical protein [Mucisphaera sp.]|uniref:hypothetical protein n=1 Tax=Mucisphaera sp. TaxID=2913024 RepID=UPI003D0D9B28